MTEPHAITRARERYGIDLTFHDMKEMAARCAKGEGLMETHPDGTQQHALVVGERVLWAVFKHGWVVTVMPAGDIANKVQRRASQHAKRRKRQRH